MSSKSLMPFKIGIPASHNMPVVKKLSPFLPVALEECVASDGRSNERCPRPFRWPVELHGVQLPEETQEAGEEVTPYRVYFTGGNFHISRIVIHNNKFSQTFLAVCMCSLVPRHSARTQTTRPQAFTQNFALSDYERKAWGRG